MEWFTSASTLHLLQSKTKTNNLLSKFSRAIFLYWKFFFVQKFCHAKKCIPKQELGRRVSGLCLRCRVSRSYQHSGWCSLWMKYFVVRMGFWKEPVLSACKTGQNKITVPKPIIITPSESSKVKKLEDLILYYISNFYRFFLAVQVLLKEQKVLKHGIESRDLI